jgi:hypothetical protein
MQKIVRSGVADVLADRGIDIGEPDKAGGQGVGESGEGDCHDKNRCCQR